MKKNGRRFFSGLLLTCMIMSLCSAFASAAYIPPDDTESSAYLSSYMAEVSVTGNKVRVSVLVDAVVYASEVGAKTIYLYESTNGTSFTRVAIYNSSSYPGMLGSGWYYADTPVEYTGVAGRYYYAAVKCYAGDSTGGDYRWFDTPPAS